MKDIIDGIKYLNGEIKDLDGKIEKGEDLRQELKARRALNHIETRRYNPKFHKDIVENQERELDEIDLQILINEGQLLTHQKERGEHTWHLKELKQRWRKQSAQDTPANKPQDKPQTPGGATGNPTGQATPEARNTESTSQKQNKANDVAPFPTPPGTQWHEVTISIIDNENVRISVKDKTERKHYFDMGFRKGKSSKPVASWVVLGDLIENGCFKYTAISKSKAEKSIEDLRKRLRAYFGIQGDPISLKDGYRPVFKLYTNESRSQSVKAFSNSEILSDNDDD